MRACVRACVRVGVRACVRVCANVACAVIHVVCICGMQGYHNVLSRILNL